MRLKPHMKAGNLSKEMKLLACNCIPHGEAHCRLQIGKELELQRFLECEISEIYDVKPN